MDAVLVWCLRFRLRSYLTAVGVDEDVFALRFESGVEVGLAVELLVDHLDYV
jgi:hypothetical protein